MALGDRVRALFGMSPRVTFSASLPGDRIFTDFYADGPVPTIGRREALSVPAVLKGRNQICSIATLPLETVDADENVIRTPLLDQIDPNVADAVTMAQTVEDLVFDAVSWWLVTSRGEDDFPASARHLDVTTVSVNPPPTSLHPLPSGIDPRSVVWVDGKPVSKRDVIRFDSPNPALLVFGGRAIRRALKLEQAAETYADNPRPLDYFSPAEVGPDPVDDDAVKTILRNWRKARKSSSTAYVPAALKYNSVDSLSPADLQLAELTKQATLEIANLLGLDPEDLGVSTTSRTYQNAVDRRMDRINSTFAPYMSAISGRLSMGDVTKPGQRVRFNIDDYLKADPKTRSEVQLAYLAAEVVTVDEIRKEEGRPKMSMPPKAPVRVASTLGQRPAAAIEAHGMPSVRFARETDLVFEGDPDATFAVDSERRVITGLAVPFGAVARSGGRRFRFAPGALKYAAVSRVKLLRDHNNALAVGKAISLTETPAGLVASFSIVPGPKGDAVLAEAAHGTADGLSIGVDFRDEDLVPDPLNPGALLVTSAALREISLVAVPAFDDSRLTSVRASDDDGRTGMPDTENTPATAPETTNPVQFSAEQVAALMSGGVSLGIQQPTAPAPTPAIVDPARSVALVSEPSSYRFDHEGNLQPAAHDFGLDMIRGMNGRFNDLAARQRAEEFVAAQFATVTTDVNELNPTINQNRYIDQREYRSPVWDRINKGAPPNGVQPFSWPAYSSASGLVGAHTEGTEPTAGSYVTTNQTVTPTATSGKAKISRETWDMGGTPGIGNLIWRQMTRGYVEALEAKAIAVLDAATPTGITLTTGGGTTGQTLAAELVAAFARLQFVRGGFSMDSLFTQIDLYLALVGAKTTDGAYLFPALGASNRDGTVRTRFGAIDINGVTALPSWALAATGTVAASSYLFDSLSVDGWATPPRQLLMPEIEVANVYVGIWGYSAAAINDITGVRELIYDPA